MKNVCHEELSPNSLCMPILTGGCPACGTVILSMRTLNIECGECGASRPHSIRRNEACKRLWGDPERAWRTCWLELSLDILARVAVGCVLEARSTRELASAATSCLLQVAVARESTPVARVSGVVPLLPFLRPDCVRISGECYTREGSGSCMWRRVPIIR